MIETKEITKKPRYTHNPFSFIYYGVKVDCDINGKITITQEHEDETFDEIKTSAGLIRRVFYMLKEGRTVKYE